MQLVSKSLPSEAGLRASVNTGLPVSIWVLVVTLAMSLPESVQGGPLADDHPELDPVAITIPTRPLEAGDRIDSVQVLRLVFTKDPDAEAGTPADSTYTAHRSGLVLETDGQVITKVELSYLARTVEKVVDGRRTREELPAHGRTVVLTRVPGTTARDGVEVTTTAGGPVDEPIKDYLTRANVRLGRVPDVPAAALRDRQLEPGEAIALDEATLAEMFFGRDHVQGEGYVYTYRGVLEDDGTRLAVFDVRQTVLRGAPDGRVQRREDVRGQLLLNIGTGLTHRLELRGTVVHTDPQGRSEGTIEVSVRVSLTHE